MTQQKPSRPYFVVEARRMLTHDDIGINLAPYFQWHINKLKALLKKGAILKVVRQNSDRIDDLKQWCFDNLGVELEIIDTPLHTSDSLNYHSLNGHCVPDGTRYDRIIEEYFPHISQSQQLRLQTMIIDFMAENEKLVFGGLDLDEAPAEKPVLVPDFKDTPWRPTDAYIRRQPEDA